RAKVRARDTVGAEQRLDRPAPATIVLVEHVAELGASEALARDVVVDQRAHVRLRDCVVERVVQRAGVRTCARTEAEHAVALAAVRGAILRDYAFLRERTHGALAIAVREQV